MFEEALRDWEGGCLTQDQAAALLGAGARTFRRWAVRYGEDGIEGLRDRRVSRASRRAAPVDEAVRMVGRYRTRPRRSRTVGCARSPAGRRASSQRRGPLPLDLQFGGTGRKSPASESHPLSSINTLILCCRLSDREVLHKDVRHCFGLLKDVMREYQYPGQMGMGFPGKSSGA